MSFTVWLLILCALAIIGLAAIMFILQEVQISRLWAALTGKPKPKDDLGEE